MVVNIVRIGREQLGVVSWSMGGMGGQTRSSSVQCGVGDASENR